MKVRKIWTRGIWSPDLWSQLGQQGARRNAMVALTALTQRRAELIEVEEFLAARYPVSVSSQVVTPAVAAHG